MRKKQLMGRFLSAFIAFIMVLTSFPAVQLTAADNGQGFSGYYLDEDHHPDTGDYDYEPDQEYDTYDYDLLPLSEVVISENGAELLTPPTFMGYAVFDMLDLRGIEIQVGTDVFTHANITPAMISWVGGRDLSYRADFIADQNLNTVTRGLIITPVEGSSVTIDLPVQRYAFAEGDYFVLRTASGHPLNGEFRRMEPATDVQHRIFGNITSDPLLGPDGKFPADLNLNALLGFVHNRGDQVGYGIMSISRERLIDSAIDNPGWAVNVWADRNVQQAAANDQLLWRIVRLPNGYYAILYVNNDASVETFGGPRAMRPATLNTNMPMPRINLSNPDWWLDSNLWFAIETGLPYDVEASVVSVGDITLADGDLYVGSMLTAGTVTFNIPGNPVTDINFQWYRGVSATGPWIAIDGATGRNYVLTDADYENWLRVGVHPGGYNIGAAVFSNATGSVDRPEFITHSADILSIRMIEMGWIDIRWRSRMAFDTSIAHDQNAIRMPESFRLTIDGEEVGIEVAMYYEFPVANPHTFMSSIRVEDWQYWWDKFELNAFNHPGSSAPLFYSWLNYDVSNDPVDIFTWDPVDGIYSWNGNPAPFDVQLQVLTPLPRHAAAGGGTITTTDVVYDVLYIPYYRWIVPVYDSVANPGEYTRIYLRASEALTRNQARANANRLRIMLEHTLYYDDVESDFLNGIITQSLQRHGFNKIISGPGENAVFMPEFRGRPFGSSPAAGYGGRNNFTNAAGGMASVNVINHEIGHAVDGFAIMYLASHAEDPEIRAFFRDIASRLSRYFAEVQDQNWFNPGFASTFRNNRGEMFAGLFEIWFNTRGQNNAQPTGRLALEAYHPEFYALAASFLLSVDFPQSLSQPYAGVANSAWVRPAPSTFRGTRTPRVFVPNRGAHQDMTSVRYRFDSMWHVEPTGLNFEGGVPTAFNSAAHRLAPTTGARPYSGGHHFQIFDVMGYQMWTGSMYGIQLNTWFDWFNNGDQQGRGRFVVTPQEFEMPDGSYKTVYTITSSGDAFDSPGGPYDLRFGNSYGAEHFLPGVFADPNGQGRHYGGISFGIINPDQVPSPEPIPVVRGRQFDDTDVYQLWYFVGVQGRYMQIANLGMTLRDPANPMVISTRYSEAATGGGVYFLEPWQMNPGAGAIMYVNQLRPTGASNATGRLTHYRYRVIPDVRYDSIMESVWIDAAQNAIFIRWTENVAPAYIAAVGNVGNFNVIQAGETIELVQAGSATTGNVTRLQLEQPADATLLGGAGLNIQFEGTAYTVSGLPLNNERTFNFRGENWPAPSAQWDTLEARIAYAQDLLNLSTAVSADGQGVWHNDYWVTAPIMNALRGAVTTGRTTLYPALNAPAVTTADIEAATAALNIAIADFVAARTLFQEATPAAPQNLRQTGATPTTITVEWDAPANGVPVAGYEVMITGGSALVSYNAHLLPGGIRVSEWDGEWINVGLATSHQFVRLAAEGEYTISVRAVNIGGEGAVVYDDFETTPKYIAFNPNQTTNALGGARNFRFGVSQNNPRPDGSFDFWETKHYIVIWHDFGVWADNEPNSEYVRLNHPERFMDFELLGPELDRIFEIFLYEMGFHVPGSHGVTTPGSEHGALISDTYKGIFRLEYRSDWNANGGRGNNASQFSPVGPGGPNRNVQVFTQSVGSTRPFYNVTTGRIDAFPTIVHEMGHSFQNTLMDSTGSNSNPWHNETHSQHSVATVYPNWLHIEHHMPLTAGMSHKGWRTPNSVWSNIFFYETWSEAHGRDFMTRLRRHDSSFTATGGTGAIPIVEHPTQRGHDLIVNYRRYFDIDQAEMSQRMLHYARQVITWDIDSMRELNAEAIDIHTSGFTNDGSDWYRIARGLAPNPYGYNAVRLDVPTGGGNVTVDFRGLPQGIFPLPTGGPPAAQVNALADHAALAGWTYGFLALLPDGTRIYSPITQSSLASPEATVSFNVPANALYVWFVVMATPTAHWHQAYANSTQEWPFELRLSNNTGFHPRNVDVIYLNYVNRTALNDAVASAQAVASPSAELAGALAAALALAADATQATVDAATDVLVRALLGISSTEAIDRLNIVGAVDAEGGNIARREHGGFLRLSHLRNHWDNEWGHHGIGPANGQHGQANPAQHIGAAERLRDGNLTGMTWITWAGCLDRWAGPHNVPHPPSFSPVHTWEDRLDWVDNDGRNRHYLTLEWEELMVVDSTRIRWMGGAEPTLYTHNRGPAWNGTFAPSPETFIEYLCPFTDEWIRITSMVNELGQGTGVLGVRPGSGAANANVWNGAVFEPVVTRAFRISTARPPFIGTASGIGAYQWEIFGEEAVPTSVTVSAANNAATVVAGSNLQFNAVVLPIEVSQQVQWSVSGHVGATISSTGLLAVGANVPIGTVLTITAIVPGTDIRDTAAVTVVAPPPPGVGFPTTPGLVTTTPPDTQDPDDTDVDTDTDVDQDTDQDDYATDEYLFTDVSSTDWFYTYVKTVVEAGLFQGTAQGIFSPGTPMTRAMFVQVIANMEGADLASFNNAPSVFYDVQSGAWYFAAVQWAYAEGITLGIGEGNFAPNAPITREQMALMIYRYAYHRDIELPADLAATLAPFADYALVSYWAIDAVEAMQAAGIITGRPDNTFAPLATATRAEVAAVFVRLLGVR